MGEYEPDDSRVVTHSTHRAPGEPPRTGPREDEARAKALKDDGEAVERKGQPTARNAAGHKEKGYAGGKPAPDPEQEPLPLGK